MVFQQNFLFSNTVAANIAFGNPARHARRHPRRLPGWPPPTSSSASCPTATKRWSANSARICRAAKGSGWRWPGRCCMNPAILLLDDATSAVDPETEHEILSADRPRPCRSGRRLSSPIGSARWPVPIGSWCSKPGGSSRWERTPNCWPAMGHYRRAARVQLAAGDDDHAVDSAVDGGRMTVIRCSSTPRGRSPVWVRGRR